MGSESSNPRRRACSRASTASIAARWTMRRLVRRRRSSARFDQPAVAGGSVTTAMRGPRLVQQDHESGGVGAV